MSDLINGREMLNRYQEDLCYDIACKDCSMSTEEGGCRVEEWIDTFPSADIPHSDDWEKYSDKLWKNAYERGKADRPQGKWIKRYGCINCSVCKHSNWSACFEDTVKSFNYCPNCGAKMKGADDE